MAWGACGLAAVAVLAALLLCCLCAPEPGSGAELFGGPRSLTGTCTPPVPQVYFPAGLGQSCGNVDGKMYLCEAPNRCAGADDGTEICTA